MKCIKQNFTDVVIDNIAWLHRYVCHKINNKDVAEDIVQEIFIKAFKAYQNYTEEGKLKGWLMRIAQNTLRNHFSLKTDNYLFSLDAEYESGESMYVYITNGITPEDEIIHKELMVDIIGVVNRLPREQKEVFTYRFVNGYLIINNT